MANEGSVLYVYGIKNIFLQKTAIYRKYWPKLQTVCAELMREKFSKLNVTLT